VLSFTITNTHTVILSPSHRIVSSSSAVHPCIQPVQSAKHRRASHHRATYLLHCSLTRAHSPRRPQSSTDLLFLPPCFSSPAPSRLCSSSLKVKPHRSLSLLRMRKEN
jgi:hypothetical protein